jgi:hypothetical protein
LQSSACTKPCKYFFATSAQFRVFERKNLPKRSMKPTKASATSSTSDPVYF